MAFSPDGRHLRGGDDGMVKVWDGRTAGSSTASPEHENTAISVAFSPDGRRLASGSWGRTLRIWDAGRASWSSILRRASRIR